MFPVFTITEVDCGCYFTHTPSPLRGTPPVLGGESGRSTDDRLQITEYRVQSTDDGLQRATSTCRDTECRVRQSKYDIVDVSDTACRVHT